MDITTLVARLPGKTNRILTFEQGRVVQRIHDTLFADVQAAISALKSWGVASGMRVGIRGPNCYEWIVYDLALIELQVTSFAFTDDFASMTAEELCDKYSLSLMLVSSKEYEQIRGKKGFVASLDGENANIEAIRRGPPPGSGFDSPWCIFSSGSSGGVKGMVLNRNGVEASIDIFTQAVVPRPDDCVLLFLPISNFQQRLIYYSALWYGFNIIVTDPNRLFRALKDLNPTILIAPPTLYEAFETRFSNLPKRQRVLAQVLGTIALKLPIRAMREKMARKIFKGAYDALGGKMRFMVTGMAPIKRSTLELFALMQLPLYETYGLIECGSVTLNLPGACKLGSTGKLLPGVKAELAEDGEIIVRKENMIAFGYFECAEGEAERTFIGDNRVATGDVGRFDKEGYLYLIGRKKEIIVTAGGEKVHPEVIESYIDRCPDVDKSVILCGHGAPSLTAIVQVRDPNDQGAKTRIEQFIERINDKRSSLSVGQIVFTDVVFTRENGLLRPNLKLDRKKIAEYFRADIAARDASMAARSRSY